MTAEPMSVLATPTRQNFRKRRSKKALRSFFKVGYASWAGREISRPGKILLAMASPLWYNFNNNSHY